MQKSAHCGNLALASFSPFPLLIFGGCLAELFSLVFPTSFLKQPHKLALVSPPQISKIVIFKPKLLFRPALRGGEMMPKQNLWEREAKEVKRHS